MQFHANHKLGLPQRHALCLAIEQGMTLKAAAAAFSVAPATAHRWWHRWFEASPQEQGSRSCLRDRSSRPHRQPRHLTQAEEEPILRARRETGFGPGRLAGICRRARSTIWKVLWRHGLSRRPCPVRPRFRRYEWSRAGALLHLDVKRLARFDHPGHRASGDRGASPRSRGAGYDYLHVVVDDNSRYAHVELCPREDRETNARCLERALLELQELGLAAPEAVMTDNAKVYGSHRFQGVLAGVGARHILIPPYTPRWNGKVERFIGTLLQEWAYVRPWESSHERARALSSFVRYYNRQRPHSSLGDRPPVSRVHNVRGQDS
jgi:transposase InsO family protein